MIRSRSLVYLLLAVAPVLVALPLWICWCHTPDELDLGTLAGWDAPLDPAGRRLVLGPGLPFGSDLGFASQSAHNFVAALGEGIPYPRWSDSCNRELGAPTFFFYPPLPYYAVAAASLFTRDLVGAFRLVLAVAGLLAALSFFLAARGLVPERIAAVGAALYVLGPFHVLDLYDRFAFASYLAYAWFPILFLFVRRLARGRDRAAWFGLAVTYAALVVTHLVSAFLVLFVLVPYALARVGVARRWSRLLPMAGAGLVALACVAVYVLPLMSHRDDVHLEWVVQASYGDWRRNFAYRDEVSLGYTPARIKPWVNRAVTAQVLLAGAAAFVLWSRRRHARGDGNGSAAGAHREIRLEGTLFAGLSAWTLFLQIPLSTPVWMLVPELGTVQFPWRFGTLQTLSVCLLLCCALSAQSRAVPPGERARPAGRIPPRGPGGSGRRKPLISPGGRGPLPARRALHRAGAVVLGIAALPAILLSARITLNRYFIFTEALAREPVYLTRVMYEYIPRGVQNWQQFGRIQPGLPRATLAGAGRVEVLEWTTHARRLRVVTPAPNVLKLRTFDFPGWTARVDGRKATIDPDNPTRMITVAVPSGEHEVVVRLEPTSDRTAGAVISFAAVATMLGFVTVPRLRSRRRRAD